MALQTIAGGGLFIPRHIYSARSMSQSASLIDATGEKMAWVGRVWNKSGTSKDIQTVGFLFGSVTKAGGSALTVSLQDVSLTSGPVHVPDETQDQTVAIANADGGFTSNAWYTTGSLSANRTVSPGDLLAVVVEYDGGGRKGADAVNFLNLDVVDGIQFHMPGCVLKTGGSWAAQGTIPNVILGFSDGSYGTLFGAFPYTATSTLSFKQDTGGADEYALEFQLPFPAKADGCWIDLSVDGSNADFAIVLYSGTSALETVTVDANTVAATGSLRFGWYPFSQLISLTANTTYRLAIKPTQTANNVNLQYFDVSTANHFQAHDGGTTFCLGSRLDLGSWAAATTTRRPHMGIHLAAFDDGTGTGGGGLLVGGSLVV